MSSIPHNFHFVYGLRRQREPFHLLHYLCLESCRQVNHPAAIYFHYHYEPFGPYWETIRPYLILEKTVKNPLVTGFRYRDPTIARYSYAHHSDFIRLEKLLERGGVYADMDTLFVKPLSAELFEKPFVLGQEDDVWDAASSSWQPSLCNAFLMASPGAEFGRRWLKTMYDEFDGSWSRHSTLLPCRLANLFPQLVHVEPKRSFCHYPPSILGLAALFEDLAPVPEGVYSIHLWEHLWWEESRIDFSQFHCGLLTRDHVQRAESTYSAAARPFLPPAWVPVPEASKSTRVVRRARAVGARVNQEVRTAAGLTVYPLLLGHLPGATAKLGLARGHRAYSAAARRFTFRNPFEGQIVRNVLQWDEYGIFDERFEAEDVVLDIGAHIGAFCFAAHSLGSRRIYAFEAYPGNFELLEKNLMHLPGIDTRLGAVFRSDERSAPELLHSGPVFCNTGGGSVVFGRNLFRYLGYDLAKSRGQEVSTPVIALDDVLSQFERVRLLKLDCEGSEYPILLTSRQLRKVQRIVGEYHVIPKEHMGLLVPEARVAGYESYGPEALLKKLQDEGFRVAIRRGPAQGLFDAVRAGC